MRRHSSPWPKRAARGVLALTIVLCGWFGFCGSRAAINDSIQGAADLSSPTASSLQSQASNQVSYQTKNIEDLVVGDTVIAMNPETGEVAPKKVLQTFERVADHLQIVTFEYSDGSSQVIETTDEHPFWLRFEKKWTRAADLKQGDTVTGPNDESQTVTDNYREEYPNGIAVYNFEVEDWHTYFVFANGSRAPPVLVHNANDYKEAAKYINTRQKVDMSAAPAGSSTNAAGHKRNGPWFWRQMLKKKPEMFSADNKQLIAEGLAPKADKTWLKHNPRHKNYVDDTLIHHHIDKGQFATPLPQTVHREFHGALHY